MLPVGDFFRLRRATETVLWATDAQTMQLCGAAWRMVQKRCMCQGTVPRVDGQTLGLTLCQWADGETRHVITGRVSREAGRTEGPHAC